MPFHDLGGKKSAPSSKKLDNEVRVGLNKSGIIQISVSRDLVNALYGDVVLKNGDVREVRHATVKYGTGEDDGHILITPSLKNNSSTSLNCERKGSSFILQVSTARFPREYNLIQRITPNIGRPVPRTTTTHEIVKIDDLGAGLKVDISPLGAI